MLGASGILKIDSLSFIENAVNNPFKCLYATIALAAASATLAQPFPSKPLRIIVPFGAGSTIDIMARTIAPKLTEALGQNVIVENRAGAGGAIGLEATARAPKDGHTLSIGALGPLAVNPSLYARMPFDPVKDFSPVTILATGPMIIVVHPNVPARNAKELVALAKARLGKLNYGSPGIGTTNHMAGELLNLAAGIKLVHVPYKGNAEALTDLLGGQLDIVFTGLPPAQPHIQAGKLRAVATTGTKRLGALPQVQTMGEGGLPEASVSTWYGLVAPGGTPRDIIDRLNLETVKTMKLPDIAERFTSQGAEPYTTTPDEFARTIRDDVAKWARVIKATGLKLD